VKLLRLDSLIAPSPVPGDTIELRGSFVPLPEAAAPWQTRDVGTQYENKVYNKVLGRGVQVVPAVSDVATQVWGRPMRDVGTQSASGLAFKSAATSTSCATASKRVQTKPAVRHRASQAGVPDTAYTRPPDFRSLPVSAWDRIHSSFSRNDASSHEGEEDGQLAISRGKARRYIDTWIKCAIAAAERGHPLPDPPLVLGSMGDEMVGTFAKRLEEVRSSSASRRPRCTAPKSDG